MAELRDQWKDTSKEFDKLRDRWRELTAKAGQISQAANKLKAQLDTVSNAMRKNPVYLQNPADPPRTGVNLIKNTGIIFLDNDEIRRIYMAGKV
jgi:uncharacterized coiled-coil DUF342 family protein